MAIAAFLSIGISAFLLILSLCFKVAGKLRLSLPLLYFLAAVISTFFTDWTSKNEKWVLLGLYILIGLVVLSWIVSLVKTIRRKKQERFFEDDVAWQIRRAREMGVPLENVTFDDDGNLLDPRTGEPVIYGEGVKFH